MWAGEALECRLMVGSKRAGLETCPTVGRLRFGDDSPFKSGRPMRRQVHKVLIWWDIELVL